ncbi:MAG: hypothetical protein KatS3mg019_0043 [Fimbriimonadales bacterium]|nr:MAG: hypothetical protein KatS3mg019_0043 [Fimbriimonadales bacterium]
MLIRQVGSAMSFTSADSSQLPALLYRDRFGMPIGNTPEISNPFFILPKRLFKNHSSQDTASTAVSLTAKSKPPPPHTTHPNTETNDDSTTTTQNSAPPTNDAATPQNHHTPNDPHNPNPPPTSPTTTPTNPPDRTPYPLSPPAPNDTDPSTSSKTPYAPRASDTSAPVTITPNKFPCESTTMCRLRPLIFLPPSYPRTPLFAWSAHSDCPPLPSWAVRVAPADATCHQRVLYCSNTPNACQRRKW